jgi:S-adenosylmethionine-diacylgycerolhomoserine-N-methlytransferase
MIPNWRGVLERAMSQLKDGGVLHVVDFGGQERLPRIARTLLRQWLTLFGVTPRDQLQGVLTQMAQRSGATLRFERPFRGYAQYAVLTLPRRARPS